MPTTEIPIDWKIVDKMLQAGCDGVQIAARIGCCPDTLYNRTQAKFNLAFSAYAAIKRANGDSLLHETQFEVATVDKDKTMLIWLGKQRLGQREPETQPSIAQNQSAFKMWLDQQKLDQSNITNKIEEKDIIDHQ